ncbi:Peptide-N(4)-(N-acetyl-beta-glucosaminyl)asparagine amidase [Vitis vinifera]|uniref:Peptide-N(4)-(N-acetyl-beta-glucosaminyl)asparagine amidase n=1 Tax=Vitis vinifera TaxID=29760 RepID=A0A438DRI0_VITVI|nr:Peptide-N(4)-(N-acetyl-beta-glucosaminyl)asparagine amidase [Vitis vinifera]
MKATSKKYGENWDGWAFPQVSGLYTVQGRAFPKMISSLIKGIRIWDEDEVAEHVLWVGTVPGPMRSLLLRVVEGSNDGGSSWRVLDEQFSQRFETRFQRKTFKINSLGLSSNAFRFRFLKVRDVEATSRLQLGSIDLYARSS